MLAWIMYIAELSFKSRLDNSGKVRMYYMIILLKFMEREAEVKLVQNFYYKIDWVCN